jgi:hypothetical protein
VSSIILRWNGRERGRKRWFLFTLPWRGRVDAAR